MGENQTQYKCCGSGCGGGCVVMVAVEGGSGGAITDL